ncbi:MAG TPA: DUF1003 domain-containing protein [Pyrinomonadaceae bacterium]|nr:DUF1003 domain-containing protein [Pyrinomonadaceae bacterium]
MNTQLREIAKKCFHLGFDSLSEREQRIVRHFVERLHISRNINRDFEAQLTFGQRVADKVASFGGSWTFIIIFAAVLLFWVLLNTFILARRGDSFDPYPYILLNLFLSMLAAVQAPIIMMSQNRQAAKDRLDAGHDYEVNLKAELEILSLHEKLDELRERKWAELLLMQQEQIRLLTRLLEDKGAAIDNERGSDW